MKYEKLSFSKNRTFDVAVVANTSCGKSTLINALIGKELLMASNKATTARNVRIIDNDFTETPIAHILFNDGKYSKIKNFSNEIIDNYNEADKSSIKDILLECNFLGIKNLKKSVVLVDTPGTNNSLDYRHTIETQSFLDKMESGLILYVFAATQICTYDDKELLEKIYKKVSENPNIKTLFVINKIDKLDRDKENPYAILTEFRDFLDKIGFVDIDIISVSAIAALLFKRVSAGEELTEDETDIFKLYYKKYHSCNGFINDLFVSKGNVNEYKKVIIGDETYNNSDIQRAIENTGITKLEKTIQSKMIDSFKYKPISIKKERKNHE